MSEGVERLLLSDSSSEDTECPSIEKSQESDSLEISGPGSERNKVSEELFYGDESDTESVASAASTESLVEDCFDEEEIDEEEFSDRSGSKSSFSEDQSLTVSINQSQQSLNECVDNTFIVEKPTGGVNQKEAALNVLDSTFLVKAEIANDDVKISTKSLKVDNPYELKQKGLLDARIKIEKEESKIFSNTMMVTTVTNKSPVEALKVGKSSSPSIENLSGGSPNKSEPIKEEKHTSTSPELPTEALKALSISGSSGLSEKKGTPRQSKFRDWTIQRVLDSPYNTRLKARLLREKELPSRREGLEEGTNY